MAIHRYLNNTGVLRHYNLLSAEGTQVSEVSIHPYSQLLLDYPGLDVYVPFCLAKIGESGEDISPKVVLERELALEKGEPVVLEVKAVAPKVEAPKVEVPEVVTVETPEVVEVEDTVKMEEVVTVETPEVVEKPSKKKSAK